MEYLGKINKMYIGKYAKKIITDDVILTEERKKHIYESHGNDYKIIINNIKVVIMNPDEILEDCKNADTMLFIRKINNNNINVIIKLSTINNTKHPKNSVMTAWLIRDSNLQKLRKKNKIIYKKE